SCQLIPLLPILRSLLRLVLIMEYPSEESLRVDRPSVVSRRSIGTILGAKDAVDYVLDCTVKVYVHHVLGYLLVMSADSAVTYTSVHSEARSWSIPSEDPYEETARQLFEQAPRSLVYVPENHIPVYIPGA
ncbi:hypothetical protein Tco_0317744, partial [Tanacetum coccineum]